MPGTITQLWRFPVKSMQGEQVERSTLGPAGLDGDRRYALVHDDTGKVLTAKRYGDLLLAMARTKGDQVVIDLPDGTEHLAGDPDTDAALTAWLGQPCHLAEPPAGAGAPEFDMSFDAEHPDQDLFAWPVAAGTYLDLAGAHLLTTSSLAAARRLHPDGDWDVRRFRPTALIDTGTDPAFVEDAWVGSTVQVGQAQVAVTMLTIRCPMPSRLQPELPKDLGVARALRDHHQNNLGVYGDVPRPGLVAVGDPVAPV